MATGTDIVGEKQTFMTKLSYLNAGQISTNKTRHHETQILQKT